MLLRGWSNIKGDVLGLQCTYMPILANSVLTVVNFTSVLQKETKTES